MADPRTPLKQYTRIQFESGTTYEITGAPIGSGGGSILYPAERVYEQDGHWVRDGINYAVKECFPVSLEHHFVRKNTGEITSAEDDPAASKYLEKVTAMQLDEKRITQTIYQTGSRVLPILESASTAVVTMPDSNNPVRIANTYTVMESLSGKGKSLISLISESGHLTALQAFRVIQQVLFSLREVHDAGFLHLDIQYGNIFLKGSLSDESDLVTLIDFGSARDLLLGTGRTEIITDRVLFTTPGFSSPEILLHNDGTLQLGCESDLYSVGCLLLYLLTGTVYDTARLMKNNTGEYLTRFKLRKIQCPAHLIDRMQEIIAHALKPVPSERYHSCSEMLEDVSDFIKALQPYRSDLKSITYDAFICYRHNPTDSAAAKKLQEYLEHFRMPFLAGHKEHNILRKPIRRVFVDEGELASCADYGAQIRDALVNSGWLIVICSPGTKDSPWVKLEIQTFLETHDRSRILAVMTSGEPDDIFPDELLGTSGKNILGEEVLAADARASTTKGVLKKLKKDALIRLAAPVVGVPYDVIRQRNKTFYMQRIAIVTSALALTGAFLLTYMFHQNKKLSDAYREQSVRQSKFLLKEAEQYLEHGDKINAVKDLTAALPGGSPDSENLPSSEIPLLPEAQLLLTNTLNLYTSPEKKKSDVEIYNDYNLASNTAINLDYPVYNTSLNRDGSCLIIQSGSYIYIRDTSTLELVRSVSSINYALIDEKTMLTCDYSSLSLINYRSGETIWNKQMPDYISNIFIPENDSKTAYALSDTTIMVISLTDGTIQKTDSLLFEDKESIGSNICFSEDGNTAFFSVRTITESALGSKTTYGISLLDVPSGKIRSLKKNMNSECDVLKVVETKEGPCLITSENNVTDDLTVSTLITCWEGFTGKKKWETEHVPSVSPYTKYGTYNSQCIADPCVYKEGSHSHLIIAVNTDTADILDVNLNTGEIENSYFYADNITCFVQNAQQNHFAAVSQKGFVLFENNKKLESIPGPSFPENSSIVIRHPDQNLYYCVNDNNKSINIYTPDTYGLSFSELAKLNSFRNVSSLSGSDYTVLIDSDNNLYCIDASGKLIFKKSEKQLKGALSDTELYRDFYLKPLTVKEDTAYFLCIKTRQTDEENFSDCYLLSAALKTGHFSANLFFRTSHEVITDDDIFYCDSTESIIVSKVTDKYLFCYRMSLESKEIEKITVPLSPSGTSFGAIRGLSDDGRYMTVFNANSRLVDYIDLNSQRIVGTVNLSTFPQEAVDNLNYLFYPEHFSWETASNAQTIAIPDYSNIHLYQTDGKEYSTINYSVLKPSHQFNSLPYLFFSQDRQYIYFLFEDLLGQADTKTGSIINTITLSETADSLTMVRHIWDSNNAESPVLDLFIGNHMYSVNTDESSFGLIAEIEDTFFCNTKTRQAYIYNGSVLGCCKMYRLTDILAIAESQYLKGNENE